VFAIVRHAAVIPIGSTPLCDTVITTSPGHVESSAARVAVFVRRVCACVSPGGRLALHLCDEHLVSRERGCFVLVCLVLTHAGVRQLMIAPHGFAV